MQIVNGRPEFLRALKDFLPSNPSCVELGVLSGEFSKMILDELDPSTLFLVDPWEVGDDKNANGQTYNETLSFLKTAYSNEGLHRQVIERFQEHISLNKVKVIKAYSYDAVENFDDASIDMVYIDACHLYESVKADIRDYLPKLKRSGLMCGHDYFEYSNFGVIRAVDEFLQENTDFEFLILNNNGFDWAIRRKIQ
jgi:hypothetical protein